MQMGTKMPLHGWSAVALLLLLLPFVEAEHAETLHVRSLPHTNKALAHFHFATTETRLSQNAVYPTVLRQILTKYDVASVHLSFAVGHYSEGLYGPAHTHDGAGVHAPFGTRLQVAFAGEEATSGPFSERWKGVTSELGGVFSASLNQMDETSLRRIPTGASAAEFGAYASPFSTIPAHFLQASLPREELCTENLTPWLKMLPCRAHAGLGMLVDPIKILSGEYAMLSLYAARNTSTGDWRIHQHLATVQSTTTGRGDRDAAFSLSSLLVDGSSSTSEIYDRIHACPLAAVSTLTTEDGVASPITTTSLKNGLSTTQPLMPTHDTTTSSHHPSDVVTVHRFQTGFGQVHGGIAVRMENRHATCAMAVTYNDVAPWYLRLYFHTFQTRIVSLFSSSPTPPQSSSPSSSVALDFVPAELRGRPNQFRVQFVLPPQSALVLSVQFDKAFVRLSEHPPDASRGFDIPSGVAMFTPLPHTTGKNSQACHADNHYQQRVVYSEPLLVALPTPDFSMPYNVITLTSTVVAFFAGSMLNTLLRKAPRIKRMLAEELPKPKSH